LRWLTIFTDLTESGMVQSFAACGFAAEPVTAACAAIMVVSL